MYLISSVSIYLITHSLFIRVFNFQVFHQHQEQKGLHGPAAMQDENINIHNIHYVYYTDL